MQSPNGIELLLPSGKAPQAGQLIRLPELAQTFHALATGGKEGFYTGRIAESIAATVQSLGGWLTTEDLASHLTHGPDLVEPIAYHYRPHSEGPGVDLVEHPPNGQGLTALIALGLIDAMQETGLVPDLSTVEHNSPVWLHAVIEALRLAFADVRYYVRDPHHGSVPIDKLLSKPYLTKRVSDHFNPSKASVDVKTGSPDQTCDTVYFSVADKHGNACSFINSTCMCSPSPSSDRTDNIRYWFRIWHCGQGHGCGSPKPRRRFHAREKPSQWGRALQASIPYYHSSDGAAQRRIVYELRCDGCVTTADPRVCIG